MKPYATQHPMALTGFQIQQLQAALLQAYDGPALKQMVRIGLDTDLAAVADGGTLREIVFELILWADRTGRADDLVAAAALHNPHNPALRDFVAQFHQGGALPPAQALATEGGANVPGSVNTAGGDFVGRDQVVRIDRSIHFHLPNAGTEQKPPPPFAPETVVIPAGPFIMGCDRGRPEEVPQHQVDSLPEFRIGKYPVTNRQYFEFVRQTHSVVAPELLWDGNAPPKDKLNCPVTGVTWYAAVAYCRWLSDQTGQPYTLPSEAQWEKAARTANGRLYPWGDEWDLRRCNCDLLELVAVDAYPAQNEYGCFDMVGNAREWTSTLWGHAADMPDPDYAYPWAVDGRDALDAPDTVRRVYRGGRSEAPLEYRCTVRGGFFPNLVGPKRDRHGFRVVLLATTMTAAAAGDNR